MISNTKLKLYLLITQNTGKRLSDILLVDDVLIPNFRISFDNISIVQLPGNRIQIFENETGTAILYYYGNSFFYRDMYYLWGSFDIDSVLNDEIGDII